MVAHMKKRFTTVFVILAFVFAALPLQAAAEGA